MTSTELLRLHLLGGFRVAVAGHVISHGSWRNRKAATLIKLLALAPDHRLHRERLMDILWPDLELEAQANNLSVVLHHLRRKLEAAGAPPRLFLAREGDMVVLGPTDDIWVDVDAFERAVQLAWRSQELAPHRGAADLYRGDLLPEDPFDERLDGARTRLRTTYQTLLACLAQLEEEHGELDASMKTLQRLIDVEPTHEEAYAGLMRLYACTGQRHLAIAQYSLLERTLARELDAEPDQHTRELCDAIRAGSVDQDSHRPPNSTARRALIEPGPSIQLQTDATSISGLEDDIEAIASSVVEQAIARLLSVRTHSGQRAQCSNRYVERRPRTARRGDAGATVP